MTYLEQMFNKFNGDYFGGRVPRLDIRFSSLHIPEWGYCCQDYIIISPVLKKYQLACEGIVIHEMIHAYLYEDDHTRPFMDLQRKINKRHFGNKGNHAIHFDKMIKDLTKRGRYDILNHNPLGGL